MKTLLFISVFMISSISFAQTQNLYNSNNKSEAVYVKLGDIKGESKPASSKRTIKIGGTEKPYAQTSNNINDTSNSKSGRFYQKRKFSEAALSERSTIKRRRVVVLKSNKQGNPNMEK